jgi:hypothetical protein
MMNNKLQPGSDFYKDLATTINTHSIDNELDTPDWILAEYVLDQLSSYRKMSKAKVQYRGAWCAIKKAQGSIKTVYVSFGEYIEAAELDTFGICDESIYYYCSLIDFGKIMSGEVKYLSDDDEVISWELVENEE